MIQCTMQSKERLTGLAFQTRRAQVQAIKDAILKDGSPELHADSTALCSHFKRRRGLVGGEAAEAQIYVHPAGRVIRFWVYGQDFSVKCRDLVLLDAGDKGPETWLETNPGQTDARLFPHDAGKYLVPAIQIVNAYKSNR